MDFVAIDFETADGFVDKSSACAIGLAFVKDDAVVRTFSSILRPPPGTKFNPQAVAIHGITETDVRNAPTLADLWPQLSKEVEHLVLVAHNAATFDIPVLVESLAAFGVTAPPLQYVCSCSFSKKMLPDLKDHKLPTVAEHLGIALDHHNAESDAVACARIMLELSRMAGITDLGILTYLKPHQSHSRKSTGGGLSEREQMLLEMFRMFGPKTQEAILGQLEILQTQDPALVEDDCYDESSPDAEVAHPAPARAQRLDCDRSSPVADTVISPSTACPVLKGLQVCFTGEISNLSRQQARDFIASCGGEPVDNVTRKTDILVVGGNKWDAFQRTGEKTGKLSKALVLLEKQQKPKIVPEAEFLSWTSLG